MMPLRGKVVAKQGIIRSLVCSFPFAAFKGCFQKGFALSFQRFCVTPSTLPLIRERAPGDKYPIMIYDWRGAKWNFFRKTKTKPFAGKGKEQTRLPREKSSKGLFYPFRRFYPRIKPFLSL